MKFKNFRIVNYKGIKDITISFEPRGANIFTLIGLNESGKTSILEAIASFNPHLQDNDEKALYSNHEERAIDPNKLIPKSLKANFTDNISVESTLILEDGDKDILLKSIESFSNNEYEIRNLKSEIKIEQRRKYANSTYQKMTNYVSYSFEFRQKPKTKRKVKNDGWKSISFFGKKGTIEQEISNFLYSEIKKLIPKITYFPTFLFEYPEKILLNHSQDDSINKIYTKAISNLAKSDSLNLDLETHIIARKLSRDNDESLQSALDSMSSNLTETIFAQWKKILQNDFAKDREIILNLSNDNGNIYINFVIKQGRERYNINERSLGFRWFFLFLLFTLYGGKDKDKQTLFLLDEPASYLHARAQQALLDSFPRITEGGSQIIYSTHSHYLINPHWLEQAYIVSNDAIDSDSLDDKIKKNIEISIHKYRKYVNDNPTKTTYFQPVLDKLNVSISKLDFVKPSVLVEGKSDFLILEYGFKVLLGKDDIAIIPMSGAHGYQGVISLLYGWGVPFLACFDDDKAGNKEKKKIIDEYPFIRNDQVITFADINVELKGKEISYILDESDKEFIREIMECSGSDKSKIQLFFSEALAKGESINELSDHFKKNIKIFYEYLKKYFEKVS